MCLTSEHDETHFTCSSMLPLCLDQEKEHYMKRLESFQAKDKKIGKLIPNGVYDGISQEKNIEMYDFLCDKLWKPPFQKAGFAAQETLYNKLVSQESKNNYMKLSLKEQVMLLLSMLSIFSTSRRGGCDLSLLNLPKSAVRFYKPFKLPPMFEKGKQHDIRLIEMSASGLYVSRSKNLLEYL